MPKICEMTIIFYAGKLHIIIGIPQCSVALLLAYPLQQCVFVPSLHTHGFFVIDHLHDNMHYQLCDRQFINTDMMTMHLYYNLHHTNFILKVLNILAFFSKSCRTLFKLVFFLLTGSRGIMQLKEEDNVYTVLNLCICYSVTSHLGLYISVL